MDRKLYIDLSGKKHKVIGSYFLALTIPDHIKPVTVNSYTLSWTLEALAKFELIKNSIADKDKNLPYASLRGLLQVNFDNLEYLDRETKLKYTKIYKQDDIQPFAYLGDSNPELINKNLRTTFNEWITDYLRPYLEKNKSNLSLVDELQDLFEDNKLININPVSLQILPWEWSKETGTTQGKAYNYLVEFIARQIAGKEIFKNCGTMKRIISADSRSSQAELMTDPLSIKGKKSKFSLVIDLEIVTFPAIHQPVLRIDVSKRRWIYHLTNARYGLGNVNGYIFSDNYHDKVFQYQVKCQYKNKKNEWDIDQNFEPLRRKFKLSLTTMSAQDIALGKVSNQTTQVVLTFRHGLQDSYDIKAGVPEIDKLEAYQAIHEILKPFGFIPFENYQEIKAKHPQLDNEINNVTLLSAMLQYLENDSVNLTPEYFYNLTYEQKNDLLKKHFSLTLPDIQKLPEQTQEPEALIKSNTEALEKLYPNDDLQLIIFYQDDLKLDLKFVENIAKITLGKKVEIKVNRLPDKVHGAKEDLPCSNQKAKERSQARIKEWERISQQIIKQNKKTFCLILAKEWYGNKHDDHINKPSTRQALAALAGSAVQFLLPIHRTKKGLIELEDYFYRVKSALKDLFPAHSGRIDNISEKVNTYLANISPEKRPKEIIGITIVRKQKGRLRSHLEQTYLLIATRLNVETGICELCYACDQNNNLKISEWYHFVEGIKEIAKISPVKLAKDQDNARIRFADFLNQVISESVNQVNNPIVLIDSSNCSKICKWLTDSVINNNNIKLTNQHNQIINGYEQMQDNWKGARIIRIRQDLAPGYIVDKVRQYAETSLEDTRSKKQLTCDYTIPSASSLQGKLLRLKTPFKEGCITYFSIGNKTLNKKQRGQSCYRKTQIHKVVKENTKELCNQADLKVCQMTVNPIFTDQYPTPNPLEIVVTLRQPEDHPDDLARFVESLRYGYGHYKDWSTLPAPLFFERVVRDYISEFSITDEEEMTSENEDKYQQLSLFE